ncbi:MAG: zinc ribbon domain-containing protein [Desulfobaccales bacterium]
MARCPVCDEIKNDDSKFCSKCGVDLIIDPTCPKCGTKYEDDDKFCKIDGSKLVSSNNLLAEGQPVNEETKKNIEAGLKQCPTCGKWDVHKAYIEDGGQGDWCPHCNKSINKSLEDKLPPIDELILGDYEVITGLKTTNTPCLWVGMDYWNLYFYKDAVIALRYYRGWIGLIGFIIGIFLYLVPSLIFMALGVWYDKSRGEAKCNLMKDKITQILSGKLGVQYKIVKASYVNLSNISQSDICLGNLWLKYKIILSNQKYYFEESKYDKINSLIKKYKGE